MSEGCPVCDTIFSDGGPVCPVCSADWPCVVLPATAEVAAARAEYYRLRRAEWLSRTQLVPVPVPPPALSVRPRRRRGEILTNSADNALYVWVGSGEFQMGAHPDDEQAEAGERPEHRVILSRGFWMAATPVTVEAYKRIAAAGKMDLPAAPLFNPRWRHEDHPMVRVSWEQAVAYCRQVGGRLPSEAEWEFAARPVNQPGPYPWGRTFTGNEANYSGSAWCGTSPVCSFSPNPLGLYDLGGNVWEWCADLYSSTYYTRAEMNDPHGPVRGRSHAVRGGSWDAGPAMLRVSARAPGSQHPAVGFRCVLDEQAILQEGRR